MVTRNEVDTRKLFNTFTNLIAMDSDFNPKAKQWDCSATVLAVKRHLPAALVTSIHTQTHPHAEVQGVQMEIYLGCFLALNCFTKCTLESSSKAKKQGVLFTYSTHQRSLETP